VGAAYAFYLPKEIRCYVSTAVSVVTTMLFLVASIFTPDIYVLQEGTTQHDLFQPVYIVSPVIHYDLILICVTAPIRFSSYMKMIGSFSIRVIVIVNANKQL